ncbi:cyclopropane-fatty-acyl-phospholipid synthase family protein [Bordetella sp. N]|uniref:SAM-dependent methyltransferase n=1 Tax=Bordetella sp. N TaxID=1746199 RepID=UPI0012E35CF7|nr:class I SAM-dependent methyltransferase [Bordetella sp. N]
MASIISYLAIGTTVLVGASFLLVAILTGVPTLSSTKSEANAIVALIERMNLPSGAVIFDLGSGWGALVVALANAFPDASVRGIEISPFPYMFSRLRAYGLPNVSLKWGNFFRADLSCADVVTCYLMPAPMSRINSWLDRSLKPGTYVVANTFLFRNRTVSASRLGILRGTIAVYVWPAYQRIGCIEQEV